jgi:arylsulfatase A-like enzyme
MLSRRYTLAAALCVLAAPPLAAAQAPSAAVSTAAAPSGAPGPEPGAYKGFNLLVISITNVGTDHMGLYGYKRDTTPELDKWAKDALVFDGAFTQASWTLPAGTSLFTGLYPYAHRIMGRDRSLVLSRGLKTLPEILRAFGYRTAAFTGGMDYDVSLGHMRGFSTAPANPPFTKFEVTLPQASKWLAADRGRKFFLFVHGYDAHPPFLPSRKFYGVFASTEGKHVTVDPSFAYRGYREGSGPDITAYYHRSRWLEEGYGKKKRVSEKKTVLTPDDVDYLTALYDENVLEEDSRVGAFLSSLDKALLDRTIIVVLSEHGEMFARHGRFGRAGAIRGTLYDDVLHVPLLIKLPGEPGRRVRGLAQLVDVMPTLLELMGLPPPARLQGASLLPLISRGAAVNSEVYAGTRYNSYLPQTYAPYAFSSLNETVRDLNWKLIHEVTFPEAGHGKAGGKAGGLAAGKGPEETFELYDLAADPGENVNLAESRPGVLKELSEKLKNWALSCKDYPGSAPSRKKMPPAVLENARQHGYW